MSDNWVNFVPEDPRYVPDRGQIKRAVKEASRLFPRADSVNAELPRGIEFFHPGGNFEGVFCPACGKAITDWWGDALDLDRTVPGVRPEKNAEVGFRLAPITLPCCGKICTLNDLRYEVSGAFGRFALSVMNPWTICLAKPSRFLSRLWEPSCELSICIFEARVVSGIASQEQLSSIWINNLTKIRVRCRIRRQRVFLKRTVLSDFGSSA